ncbi:hypothetical protein HYALB_00003604 [Hymenoscyphus albidus]|uniref:DUF7918 domain-containing protein n=1 Tax=Hymenoscyphus albidus TaxID=595503 RepID=A0A9N9QBJ4_9HELO|nr:hypothetical protein HYALB_00003604 [Hymenoscyphus albidus]
MAIHPDLPGIEVTVSVGGEQLFEYAAENEPLPRPLPKNTRNRKKLLHQHKATITKYIEIVDGSVFTINLSAKAPYVLDCPKLQFRAFVDNNWIREPIMTQDDYKDKDWSDVVEGPVGEVDSGHRPMIFSTVETTSEQFTKAVVAEHKDKMSGVGEIIVEVHRRTEGRAAKPSKDEIIRDFEVTYEDKVHEKATALTATSHGTTYGVAARGDTEYNLGVWQTATIDGEDFMRAQFVFKYRSKEALKKLLVIPRSPSPDPEPEELEIIHHRSIQPRIRRPAQARIDDAILTAEEKEELTKKLAEMRGVKREREDENIKEELLTEMDIKREHLGAIDSGFGDQGEPRRRKKPKKWTGKTIVDLTESDQEIDPIVLE